MKITYLLLLVLFVTTSCKSTYHLASKNGTNQAIDNRIDMDSNLVNLYAPYKEQLEKTMNKVIGTAAQSFIRNRSQPTTLATNFFAETLLSIGKNVDADAEVSFATKDGIRSDIKKGDITVGSIFEFMPFENYIVILELNGTDFLRLCQFIAKTNGQPIAGFKLKIQDGQAKDIYINGKPFDVNKTYKVVTYDYLANGGDYIVGFENPVNRQDTPIRIREGLIDFIEKQTQLNKQIDAKLDDRITISK